MTDTTTIELTQAELEIIRRRRAEAAQDVADRSFQVKAVQTAARWFEWAGRTGECLTFSTFVNAFGYEDDDHAQMYEAVVRIQSAAWPR